MTRRGNQPTIVVERGGGSSLLWLVVGGALGAGLALLFAPQSGERTRRQVGRKLSKWRDAADAAFEDLRESLGSDDRVHRSLAETEAEDDEEIAEEAVSESEPEARVRPARRSGPGSARQELEHRLAEARARRQRAMADEDEEPVA